MSTPSETWTQCKNQRGRFFNLTSHDGQPIGQRAYWMNKMAQVGPCARHSQIRCESTALSPPSRERECYFGDRKNLTHGSKVLPHQFGFTVLPIHGSLDVIGRRNSIPIQLDAVRPSNQRQEQFLRTAISLPERVHLIQGDVSIRHSIHNSIEGCLVDVFECCLQALKNSRPFNFNAIRGTESRQTAIIFF